MKRLFFPMLAALVFASIAMAQTGAPGQQPPPQNVPITPEGGQRTRNPQRGEDVGQQGKGMPVAGQAQSEENAFPANMPILATLSKTIDAKKAKQGEPVTAKVEQDVLSQGNIILPRGSRLDGHVTVARARSKSEASELGIAWDKAVLKSGKEIPVHAVIQALAPPPQMTSSEPPMGGAESGGMSGAPTGGIPGGQPGMGPPQPGAGQPPIGPPAGEPGNPGGVSNPSTGTSTNSRGGGLTGPMLSAASRGAQGMPGVTLNAGANAAEGSVITSERQNVKLNSGTQLVLRIVNQ